MSKYYFNISSRGNCLEECQVKKDGTMIGSVTCQKCEHNKGFDGEFSNDPDWIKCALIDDATKKEK